MCYSESPSRGPPLRTWLHEIRRCEEPKTDHVLGDQIHSLGRYGSVEEPLYKRITPLAAT
jgi:hypothetical protein